MDLQCYDEVRRRLGLRVLPLAQGRAEVRRIVAHLQRDAAPIRCAGDVYAAIAASAQEDELGAEQCREGIAVTHGSEGWIVLLRSDESLPQQVTEESVSAISERGAC